MTVTIVSAWRVYRRASHLAAELSTYVDQQAVELGRISAQLSEHGVQLEDTMNGLAPKLQTIAVFLRQPLVAATIPWLLRRAFGRPYRRR